MDQSDKAYAITSGLVILVQIFDTSFARIAYLSVCSYVQNYIGLRVDIQSPLLSTHCADIAHQSVNQSIPKPTSRPWFPINMSFILVDLSRYNTHHRCAGYHINAIIVSAHLKECKKVCNRLTLRPMRCTSSTQVNTLQFVICSKLAYSCFSVLTGVGNVGSYWW